MLVLFPCNFVKNTRRSWAMPAFFASLQKKITSLNGTFYLIIITNN